MKVVTLDGYLRMKRESEALAKVEAKAKAEKKEKAKKAISFFAGIILYWIACFFLTMGLIALYIVTL